MRNRGVSLLIPLLFISGCAPAIHPNYIPREEPPDLFRIEENYRVGYIDAHGRVRIPPQFGAMSGDFSEGLAVVHFYAETIRFGYIDEEGTVVIGSPAQVHYIDARPFSEGLAAVKVRSDSEAGWGYIDKAGRMVIRPQFEDAGPFSEGLARVVIDSSAGLVGFVDRLGAIVITPQFFDAGDFSHGLARVQLPAEEGQPISDGITYSDKSLDPRGGLSGYIDPTGRMAIAADYKQARDFSEGLAAVRYDDGGWFYIDRKGKSIIHPFFWPFATAESFAEGLARVNLLRWGVGTQFGYINNAGRIVIDLQFDYGDEGAGRFSAGLAPVSLHGKWGYIDVNGNLAIQPKFDYALPYSGGLARVNIGGPGSGDSKWGYIDETGEYVWEPR